MSLNSLKQYLLLFAWWSSVPMQTSITLAATTVTETSFSVCTGLWCQPEGKYEDSLIMNTGLNV